MSSDTGQPLLSKQQKDKIRTLLSGSDSDQILLAIMLIESSSRSADDHSEMFPTSTISSIFNTWNLEVWNAVAPHLQQHEILCQSFRDYLSSRLPAKNSSFREQFLGDLFERVDSPVIGLLGDYRFLCDLNSWELNELPTLPDAAFGPLARHHDRLTLDGQLTLSDQAAETLVELHGANLNLRDLSNLPDAAAALSRTAAKTLGQYKGTLTHGTLNTMSDAIGKLSTATAELSSDANHVLQKHRGTYLSLNGLSTLSDAAADSFSRYRGASLSLGGLTALSDVAAESLAHYQGLLVVSDDMATSKKLLTNRVVETFLSDKNTARLVECNLITFSAAEALAKYQGALYLDGLTSLSDAVAKVLAEHRGWLLLNGLTKLSDAAAKSLSKHKGQNLYLDGLTELSDAAAKSLSRYAGSYLFLNGLTELSDAAAESFATYRGGLSLSGTPMKVVRAKRRSDHDERLLEDMTQNGTTE